MIMNPEKSAGAATAMPKKSKPSPPDMRKILDSVAVGIFTVDTDWNITSFNAEAERLTGFTREEALGAKCYDIFYTRFCNEKCYLQKAIRTGHDIHKARLTLLDKHNRPAPVEITAAALRDAEGRVIGGVESLLDVSEKLSLEKELKNAYALGDCLSRDEGMLKIFDMLRVAAPSGAALLILGETGTGKDLLARSAHDLSGRKSGPFIKVNCAALPEHLLESELFGYKKGAFTDAKKDKPGMFRLAHGGTLFLDEAGELPLGIQAKLLQAIEDKRYYPLGASSPQETDVRIIAATNRDLAEAAATGAFRGDLYYRLRVLEIRLPPLRNRRGDIALLADHFLGLLARRHGKAIQGLTPEAARLLFSYEYPGNVRELLHILEHAVILCQGPEILLEHLPESLIAPAQKALDQAPRPMAQREREYLLETLEANGWNVGKAAQAMGINRTTVWRRMKKHGL